MLALLAPTSVFSAPTLGFVETWPGTSTQGWSGGIPSGIVFSNPGTGGVGGPADGFLKMELATQGNFGARSVGPEYTGDWSAAGITRVRVWLNDIGADQPLEIHFSVGNFDNLWQYDTGFIPPLGEWAPFVVDLTDPAAFTHIIDSFGQGFGAALQNVALVHLRHDLAPFMQLPDQIAGDLGIDNLLLTNAVVGAAETPGAAPRPTELAPPYPNPAKGPVAITLSGPASTAARIEIVDPQGRRLRRVALAAAGGPRVWLWDGRDDSGRPVPPGVYRVWALGPGGGTSRSLVIVR